MELELWQVLAAGWWGGLAGEFTYTGGIAQWGIGLGVTHIASRGRKSIYSFVHNIEVSFPSLPKVVPIQANAPSHATVR